MPTLQLHCWNYNLKILLSLSYAFLVYGEQLSKWLTLHLKILARAHNLTTVAQETWSASFFAMQQGGDI